MKLLHSALQVPISDDPNVNTQAEIYAQIRDSALEDAARVCDKKCADSSLEMFKIAMRLSATAIRALKNKDGA